MTLVQASADWQRIEFLSDVHLHADEAATAHAWTHCLRTSQADAIFILGDLFEVWVGDDDDAPFVNACVETLTQVSQQRLIYFLCGNRDFLVGERFMQRTGVQPLDDPAVLDLGETRFLLSHGDVLCVNDTEYLAFRREVRSPTWQHTFLARPLAERHAVARALRTQSEARTQTQLHNADIDGPMAQAWLTQAQASMLIHGHTHRPGVHTLSAQHTRWCLSDWDALSAPPQPGVTVVQAPGGDLESLSIDEVRRVVLPLVG